MKRAVKIFLLLPVMALVELACLAACWAVALISRPTARRMTNAICATIPNRDWYFS